MGIHIPQEYSAFLQGRVYKLRDHYVERARVGFIIQIPFCATLWHSSVIHVACPRVQGEFKSESP